MCLKLNWIWSIFQSCLPVIKQVQTSPDSPRYVFFFSAVFYNRPPMEKLVSAGTTEGTLGLGYNVLSKWRETCIYAQEMQW